MTKEILKTVHDHSNVFNPSDFKSIIEIIYVANNFYSDDSLWFFTTFQIMTNDLNNIFIKKIF